MGNILIHTVIHSITSLFRNMQLVFLAQFDGRFTTRVIMRSYAIVIQSSILCYHSTLRVLGPLIIYVSYRIIEIAKIHGLT